MLLLIDRTNIPSQGSGSFAAARSSIENLTSTPFSMRDSGSAFISQYERPVSFKGALSVVDSGIVLGFSSAMGSSFLGSTTLVAPLTGKLLRGRPRPSFFVVTAGLVGAEATGRLDNYWSAPGQACSSRMNTYQAPCGDARGHPSS